MSMKTIYNISRILGLTGQALLYWGLDFHFLGCFLGAVIVYVITIPPQTKKSEAATSDS